MDFNKYLQLPIKERFEIVKTANGYTAPFWLERLQTAIINCSPLVVMISKPLVDEYWTLQNYKTSKTMSNCTKCQEDLKDESLDLLDENIKEITCPYCQNEMEIEYDEDYSEGHKQSIIILTQK